MIELSDRDLVRIILGRASMFDEESDPIYSWLWDHREPAVSRMRDASGSVPLSAARREPITHHYQYTVEDDWATLLVKVVWAFEAYPMRKLDDGWIDEHDVTSAASRLLEIHRPMGVDFLYPQYVGAAVNLAVRIKWLERQTFEYDGDDVDAIRLLNEGEDVARKDESSSSTLKAVQPSSSPPMGVKTTEAFIYIRDNPGRTKREVAAAVGIYFDSFGYHWDILRANGCRLGLRNQGCFPPGYDFSARLTG